MSHGHRELLRLLRSLEAKPAAERIDNFEALSARQMLAILLRRVLRGLQRRFQKR